MSDKRQGYISWDEYFMGVAMLSGMRSKDPNTQVGACIVSPDHKILSMGYNGLPIGCSDDEFPWCREGDPLENKYFYTAHSELNAILNYPGAKWGMAAEIVSMMPKHRSYLEPFFGSGAVLFNKPPSAIETVNDIDGEITNFFRVLREQTDELIRAISLTPYSREVFDDAHENRGVTEFDRAYRFAIRFRMGHGFKTYQKTGFKIDRYARERSYCVDVWNKMPSMLSDAAERLKRVQIENRPALDLIKKFNFSNVLIYADPPYLLDTRGGKQYRHEMDEQDHLELLAALKSHKGYVILSGYPSEMYDRELRGWNKIQRKSYNQNSDQRTEVLWFNFMTEPTLFDYKEN